MNYLAHSLPFLDRPYYAAGAGVPDWLTVADRPVRLRQRGVTPFLGVPDDVTAAIAGGVWQHLRDDARFHETRAFMECNLSLVTLTRDALGAESGFRPSFLGHLLVEVLLDAALAAEDRRRLDDYYAAIDTVDPWAIEAAVNKMATRPTQRLALLIVEFRRHRILFDYLDDGRLFYRLNQVMRRVGFPTLPADFATLLPVARNLVADRAGELLADLPTT